jgi:hypothetical protein
MTKSAQKEKERRQVSLFLSCAGLHAEVLETERPDFVLSIEGEKIGLEVRELTDRFLMASHANTERHVEEQLREAVLKMKRPVVLIIALRENLAAFREREVANSFVERVRWYIQGADEHGEDVEIRITDRARLSGMGLTEVAAFAITTLEVGEQPLVSISQIIMSFGGDTSLIKVAHSDKEPKLAEYRRNTGALRQWLLLVTGENLGQPLIFDSIPEDFKFTSGFERIYVLDTRMRAVKQLQTLRSV